MPSTESEESRVSHPDSHLFNEYLENFQEDLDRIVGKFRYSHHQLSHRDLISEINLSLINKRDEILTNFKGEFTEVNFKKIAYGFARNVITWTQWKIVHSPYVGQRTDLNHATEDGVKTTFDWALSTNGSEDDRYEDSDRNAKCSFLLKMIKEYSALLTDREVKVLSFLEKGMNHYEIADRLGVTHQAISLMSIKVGDKIKAHLSHDALQDNSYEQVSKGHKSISDFFRSESQTSPMKARDKAPLRNFLLKNARRYSPSQACKVFLGGKYSNRQISSFANRNKLSFCLLRDTKVGYKYSNEETDKVLSLLQKNKSCKKISSLTGIPLASIRGKKASLVRFGFLDKYKNEAVE